MLNSLFGDLGPRRLPDPTVTPPGQTIPASSASAAGTDAAVRERLETQSLDVVVDGSPTEAIRAHFADARQDLQRANAMLTLLDPSRLWASQVLHALAGAGGQPVQRLNLRERASLRTLAVIERTLVPRRAATALRVYHADIRGGAVASGIAPEEITCALAEASQMTAVIVGAMQPHALVALLRGLLQACSQPEWRCPHLVFLLPPGAATLRQRILDQPWPAQLQVQALTEPLDSAASVWNRVLQVWETGQTLPAEQAPALAPVPASRPVAAERQPAAAPAHRPPALPTGLTPLALNRLLLPLARSEGLVACAIVALDTGDLLATQQREQPAIDLSALADALCAARLAHQAVAASEAAPDEILVTTGARQTLLRRLPGEAALGFVAVLDRQQANLALLRFKLLDAERLLS